MLNMIIKFNETEKTKHFKILHGPGHRAGFCILASDFSLIDLCHLNWILVKIKCHGTPGKMSRKN